MSATIAQWLDGIGLGRYAQAFADNDIDFANLPLLTEEDFRELGLSIGHRRTLQAAIGRLPADGASAEVESDKRSAARGRVTAPEAQRRQLTVLFCDLVGSTALASRLDPEDMRDLLRRYQDCCATVVARHEGFVAKFMGDGVYAYFGYPKAHEDDAERAVQAALDIVAAIEALRADVAGIEVRVAVATGNVAVGDLIGEAAAEETNVVGEAPNLAARLQALAEPGSVLIADTTHRLVGGMFEADDLGRRTLKGVADPVRVWKVLRTRANASRFDAMRGAHLTELVGRDEELALLRRRWARAREGEGQAVMISGEPGIGKSRLVRAFRDSLRDEPVLFRTLQCSPRHTNSALFPFLELALSGIGLPADVGDDVRLDRLDDWLRMADQEPAEMAPVFGPYLNIDTSRRYPAIDLPPKVHKQRLYDAMCQRLLSIAEKGGLVLVVEDAHWIDPSSLELLGMYMDRALERPNIMIVVTYRPEFEAPWVGRPHTSLIALNRLGRRECVALVTKVSGTAGLRPELVDQISARTDGVPLFVEELTRVVIESSTDRLDSPVPDVPATLHDSLVARLDGVGPARELAQLAACIGRSFPTWLLAALREVRDDAMDALLAPLVEAGLIYPERQRNGAGYAFKHAMVQQAAYAGLLRGVRRDYHARIADALIAQGERDPNADLVGIAHHLQAANDIARALHFHRAAARQARDAGSLRESLDIVNRGFDLLGQLEEETAARDREELELLVEKLPVVTAIDGYASAEIDRISARALELAVAIADRDRESSVLYQIATMHEGRGEFAMTQATLARRRELIQA
ncbi:MAG: AAA family ATPase, partial [Alphaproteobacteria bacterium]